MKIAFNTIACPDWTLERVMGFADDVEYDGVELRTFGWSSQGLACEPALTDDAKIRRMAIDSGTHLMCLATSLKFDDAVFPPVVGQALSGKNRYLETAKRFLTLADDIECPMVRVFGFGIPASEKRSRTIERIVERLNLVLDAARARQVRLVLENGGSFCKASDLDEIVTLCDNPWLGASYNIAVGNRAGDHVEESLDRLGEKLWTVKLSDIKGTQPVRIGLGEMPIERAVRHLAQINYTGWLVVEWMKYWHPHLDDAQQVLAQSIEVLRSWTTPSSAVASPCACCADDEG